MSAHRQLMESTLAKIERVVWTRPIRGCVIEDRRRCCVKAWEPYVSALCVRGKRRCSLSAALAAVEVLAAYPDVVVEGIREDTGSLRGAGASSKKHCAHDETEPKHGRV